MSENEKKSGAVKSRISGLLTRIASGGVYVGISVIAVLVNDVTNSASALLMKVLQAYPEDTVQLLMEMAEEL